jgi:hypothetical protein
MAADRKGSSWAVLAMSEMGKGVWLKARLAADKPKRLLIWDVVDEYDRQARKVATFAELLRAIAAPTFAVRYVPKGKKTKDLRAEFETFCLIAYAAAESVIVVEELADVTSPSWAPPAWRALNTRGRHHQGLTLYWCSQSPAFIDKASLGNATHMHVGYLGEPRHRQAAAAHMGCNADDINALKQGEYLEYVKATKELSAGAVSIPGVCRARAPRPHAHGDRAESP